MLSVGRLYKSCGNKTIYIRDRTADNFLVGVDLSNFSEIYFYDSNGNEREGDEGKKLSKELGILIPTFDLPAEPPLIEEPDYYEIPYRGELVDSCYLYTDLKLHIGDKLKITIEEPCSITLMGHKHEKVGISDKKSLWPFFELWQKEVNSIKAWKTGTLEIRFEDGDELSIPGSLQYESWNIEGYNGLMIVSTPTGLAVWESNSAECKSPISNE